MKPRLDYRPWGSYFPHRKRRHWLHLVAYKLSLNSARRAFLKNVCSATTRPIRDLLQFWKASFMRFDALHFISDFSFLRDRTARPVKTMVQPYFREKTVAAVLLITDQMQRTLSNGQLLSYMWKPWPSTKAAVWSLFVFRESCLFQNSVARRNYCIAFRQIGRASCRERV